MGLASATGSVARKVGASGRDLEPEHRRDGAGLFLFGLAVVAAAAVWWQLPGSVMDGTRTVVAGSVGPPGRWVHFGLTSSDVLDTGLALQLRDPDLAFVRDVDPVESSATRRTAFERFSGTDTLVCTGHLPPPGVGYLRRDGDGFALMPPPTHEIHEGKI